MISLNMEWEIGELRTQHKTRRCKNLVQRIPQYLARRKWNNYYLFFYTSIHPFLHGDLDGRIKWSDANFVSHVFHLKNKKGVRFSSNPLLYWYPGRDSNIFRNYLI